MPNRILRGDILTSEPVNSLGWAEECFYRRLHSIVDDFGRYYGHPSLVRAAAYPLRLNDVSDQDVGKWLAVCAAKGLVRVYLVDGKRYIEVVKFGQQVRALKSKFPEPPINCEATDTQMPSGCAAHAPVVEVEVDKRSRRATPAADPPWLPKEWAEFEQHRKEKRETFTPTARAGCIAKLGRWKDAGHDVVAILRYSIDNGYTGIFEPKPDVKKSAGPPWWSSDASIEAKAREMGMWPPRGGESWQQLKGRINERLGAN